MKKREEIEKEIAKGGANEYNQKLIIEILLDIRDSLIRDSLKREDIILEPPMF